MIGFKRLLLEGLKNPRGAIAFLTYLPQFIRLYARLLKDPRVPIYLKCVVILALLYLISPIDLFPDFLVPILGHLDDLLILSFSLRYFLKKCPRELVLEHVQQIESERFD
ncbi:MAG TPA: DUF1232 domain-containing protein [bacterium]